MITLIMIMNIMMIIIIIRKIIMKMIILIDVIKNKKAISMIDAAKIMMTMINTIANTMINVAKNKKIITTINVITRSLLLAIYAVYVVKKFMMISATRNLISMTMKITLIGVNTITKTLENANKLVIL
ncbi:hypothetical protein A500_00845 [Clostridium sartagoforme AAU1]|uniref:Uncharacterized protein n=1 Tax=Clostridium sartagoforme AAU1 TaxID=1202534 RepID=R9CGI1_9CLOT|nr:hypothetical protein A500_00845 [Clostridium sartagoforme AAU1]